MKKLILCTIASLMMISFIPNNLQATNTLPTDQAIQQIQQNIRLNEIESMDKSELSFQEKQDLRQETRAIKSDMHDGGYGGIYISVGALIIIIIILIIIL